MPVVAPLRLAVLASALVLLGGGCARRDSEPPPPGGIYRSDDGGVSFTQVVTRADGGNLARIRPVDAAIAPPAPDRLLVVAEEGVFRSDDGGGTWTPLPIPARQTFSVSIHPRNPDVLFAAIESREPRGRGQIVKSVDGGRTWVDVFTAPTTEEEVGTIVRRRRPRATLVTAVAVNPAAPEEVFAGTSTGALLFSPDGGLRWQTRYAFATGISGLKVSSAEAGRILVRLADGQLARSGDGGATVEPVALGVPEGLATGFQPRGTPVYSVLFARPTERGAPILLGTADGLFRSLDGGATLERLPLPPTGQADTPVRSLAESPDGTLWAASGFVLFSSTDGGQTWRSTDTPLRDTIRFVLTDPSRAARVYLVFRP